MTGQSDSEFCDVDYKETIDLVIKSTEMNIKAACAVATLPVKCYSTALKCWADAVSDAFESCFPDECETDD